MEEREYPDDPPGANDVTEEDLEMVAKLRKSLVCDICGKPIEQAAYHVRLEWRKKAKAVTSRAYDDVCDRCGFSLVHRLQQAIEDVKREQRSK